METVVGVLGLLVCLVWLIRCELGVRGEEEQHTGTPLGSLELWLWLSWLLGCLVLSLHLAQLEERESKAMGV